MPRLVNPQLFDKLMRDRSTLLLSLAKKLVHEGAENLQLSRPCLGVIQAESTQLEELLDAYGARNNLQWYPFRMQIAILKNFSTAGYELLHLLHTSQGYSLDALKDEFQLHTLDAVNYVSSFIFCALKHLLLEIKDFSWPPPEDNLGFDFSENLPIGYLPRNRKSVSSATANALVIKLATGFLNITEDAKSLLGAAQSQPPEWKGIDFSRTGEVFLRALEGKIHNLQSTYDTHISDSDTESDDDNVPKLGGHISIVLHLLRVATIFAHFYERHFKANAQALFCNPNCVLASDWFMELFAHYLCYYSYEFMDSARNLCQSILKKYAVIRTWSIPVPPFFGFHVRPSVLVSSIVMHYGSKVTMVCDNVAFDAKNSMDLWRSNEWINQKKRLYIFNILSNMDLSAVENKISRRSISNEEGVLEVIRMLAERGALRLLRYPLPIAPLLTKEDKAGKSLFALTQDVICALHTHRHLSILLEVKAKFRGDIRVLGDLRVLAEHGYGENEFGTNIPLPPELIYLNNYRQQ